MRTDCNTGTSTTTQKVDRPDDWEEGSRIVGRLCSTEPLR